MRNAALIVAAGRGLRAGLDTPKQFAPLGGRPVLAWSLGAFEAHPGIASIHVAVAEDHADLARELCAPFAKARVALGGPTRTDTVRRGLAAIAETGPAPDFVLIHDAARPGLSAALIDRVLAGAAVSGAAAPGLLVPDALKRVAPDGAVLDDVPREGLQRAQTPQAFAWRVIVEAYSALAPGRALEDDLAVARAVGVSPTLVPGDPLLAKITYPEDLDMAARLLGAGRTPRVGAGFDVHRFGPGDGVVLCGVRIAHDRGLIGHSDADVAWHALTDAILGALALGDIGDHFPPSDERWRGAPSSVFLRHALALARERGAELSNVDLTLMCERPKIKPHREAMRRSTADLLGLDLDRVSVKATTTEKLGFAGREEGLAAQAVATLLA